jgi:hypothetical protein
MPRYLCWAPVRGYDIHDGHYCNASSEIYAAQEYAEDIFDEVEPFDEVIVMTRSDDMITRELRVEVSVRPEFHAYGVRTRVIRETP